MPPAPTLIVESPAKLNLALSVGPRQTTGGLHPICSWMVTIDLVDDLEVRRLEADRFSRYAIMWHESARRPTDIDWPIKNDLAVRAHLALEEHLGRKLPVQLKLQKRIPVGCGLGGGSSNAAAMLRAVNELFELGLGDDVLAAVAEPLGSDVPFFVRGGSAVVEGLGEVIDRHADTPEIHAVVAFPPSSCPTGEVYGIFDGITTARLRPEDVRAIAGKPIAPQAPFNDLAAAAARRAPELIDALRRISALAERPAHVTGSGSGLFVICDDTLHAEALARNVEARLDLPAIAVRTHQHADAAAT